MSNQYKRFSSTNKADVWVKEYQSFFPSNSDNDKVFLQALDFYTASGNLIFNNYLRQYVSIEKNDYLYPYIMQMIKKLPNYEIPDNIIVYRYIKKALLKEMCKSYPPKRNAIIQDSGFMSTTLVRSSILQFKREKKLNILLIISVPKGTKGTYVGLLHNTLSEHEIILAQNTKLRIDAKLYFPRIYYCTVCN
ncbi:MAG: hypothetical protein HDQ99_21715 [Lachnospiraceae bacterium]|nr:hypothetical protein [Lachnospiraceae bacterium]